MLLADAKAPGAIIDVLVYPICFNFRHAIELYVKHIIADLSRVQGTGQRYQPRHSLLRNWKKAKKLLKTIDHTADDAALFEEVVRHIEEVDPTAQTFRYPELIKYDQHLKDWPSINLAVVEQHYARLFAVAKNWQYRIDHAVDRASQDGTLAPRYRRAPDKNALVGRWHFLTYRAKNAGLRIQKPLRTIATLKKDRNSPSPMFQYASRNAANFQGMETMGLKSVSLSTPRDLPSRR